MQQGIITLANFCSEQLEGDLKRTQLIDEGQITRQEADEQAELWERVRILIVKADDDNDCTLCGVGWIWSLRVVSVYWRDDGWLIPSLKSEERHVSPHTLCVGDHL
jgi:hypothetical protein